MQCAGGTATGFCHRIVHFPYHYNSTSSRYSFISQKRYMNSAPSNTILKNWISEGLPKRVRDIPVNEGWRASRRPNCLLCVLCTVDCGLCTVDCVLWTVCHSSCSVQAVVTAHTDCQLDNLSPASSVSLKSPSLVPRLTANSTEVSPFENLLSLSYPRNYLQFMQPIFSATTMHKCAKWIQSTAFILKIHFSIISPLCQLSFLTLIETQSLCSERTAAESCRNSGYKLAPVTDGHRRELFHEGSLCLSGLSDDAITSLNLPTAIPFIFEFDADFKPVVSMRFLSDEDTVRTAMEKVASIGNARA
jgi:hypothetical protein